MSDFPPGLGAVSMVSLRRFLLIGFITESAVGSKPSGILFVLKGDTEDGRSFELGQSFEFAEPPVTMTVIGNFVLVAVGRYIKFIRYSEDLDSFELIDEEMAPVATQVGYIEIGGDIIWVGDRSQSVSCHRFALKDGGTKLEIVDRKSPIAVDVEPRILTALGVVDNTTVVVGERSGLITILRLPNDLRLSELHWRSSAAPDRGIRQPYASTAGHLIKVAVFSVNEAVTSLMKRGNVVYYTTLLGQIGALIPVEDADFGMLMNAEWMTWRACACAFGVTHLRKYGLEQMNVVSGDVLEFMEQLPGENQRAIEDGIRMPRQGVAGLVCRLKHLARF
jgi:hypothetical protein